MNMKVVCLIVVLVVLALVAIAAGDANKQKLPPKSKGIKWTWR